MDWVALVQGVEGLYSAAAGAKAASSIKRAAARDDAMGPYRAGYAAQLAALSKDPDLIMQNPGYQAALRQGEQTLERTAGKQGQLGGGTEKEELQSYSQIFAGQYLHAEQARLAGLAGANFQPMAMRGAEAAAGLQSSSLASAGYGIQRALDAGKTKAATPGATTPDIATAARAWGQ